MKRRLSQDSFIRVLFDTMPNMALVLDPEWRVHGMNRATKEFIGRMEEEFPLERCGKLMDCLHNLDHPLGCGFGEHCDHCVIRKTALEAVDGQATRRAKGKFELASGKVLSVLVSASPFDYLEQRFALVMMEDISLITELQGLIPICASCKRVRDDRGYWSLVEKYIEEHSEAEFTHGICPDCEAALYPALRKRSVVAETDVS